MDAGAAATAAQREIFPRTPSGDRGPGWRGAEGEQQMAHHWHALIWPAGWARPAENLVFDLPDDARACLRELEGRWAAGPECALEMTSCDSDLCQRRPVLPGPDGNGLVSLAVGGERLQYPVTESEYHQLFERERAELV